MKEGFSCVRLPGGANPQVRIRVVRRVPVHVHSIRVEVPNIDKVPVRRALLMPFSPYSAKIYNCISFVFNAGL